MFSVDGMLFLLQVGLVIVGWVGYVYFVLFYLGFYFVVVMCDGECGGDVFDQVIVGVYVEMLLCIWVDFELGVFVQQFDFVGVCIEVYGNCIVCIQYCVIVIGQLYVLYLMCVVMIGLQVQLCFWLCNQYCQYCCCCYCLVQLMWLMLFVGFGLWVWFDIVLQCVFVFEGFVVFWLLQLVFECLYVYIVDVI